MAEQEDGGAKRGADVKAGLFAAIVDPAAVWESVVEYLRDNADPSDVFDNEQLEKWATTAGFKKEE